MTKKERAPYPRRGEEHHRAKLTDAEVELMRQMHEEGDLSLCVLAVAFGVGKSTVRQIVTYRSRRG